MGTNSATKVLANLLGPAGITVNAICPGSTNTRRWDELVSITMEKHGLDKDAAEERLCEEVPLGCVIRPEDILIWQYSWHHAEPLGSAGRPLTSTEVEAGVFKIVNFAQLRSQSSSFRRFTVSPITIRVGAGSPVLTCPTSFSVVTKTFWSG